MYAWSKWTVGYIDSLLWFICLKSAFCPSIITHPMQFCQSEEQSSREEMWSQSRGGSRIFLVRGALVRHAMTDWCGKQILKVNTKNASSWGGGCVHPLHPPPRSPCKEQNWDCKNEDEYDSELYLIMDTVVRCVVD